MFYNFQNTKINCPKWVYYFLIGILLFFGLGFYYASIAITSYKHDNEAEEAVEKLLEKATGLDIDFSPDSPEPQP